MFFFLHGRDCLFLLRHFLFQCPARCSNSRFGTMEQVECQLNPQPSKVLQASCCTWDEDYESEKLVLVCRQVWREKEAACEGT